MSFNNLIDYLHSSIEYQDFLRHGHLTAISLMVFVASVSAVIQTWGMLTQNKRIWENRSGTTLPLTFFAFQFFYFMAYLIYGIKINSLSIILNNFVGVFFLPIIIGLIKFKLNENSSFRNELIVFPFLVLILPFVLIIKTKLSLIAILFLAIIVFTHLMSELFKTKMVKNIEPKFIFSMVIGSAIWLWYGFRICDFGLITSSGVTIAGASLFYLYFRKFKKSALN